MSEGEEADSISSALASLAETAAKCEDRCRIGAQNRCAEPEQVLPQNRCRCQNRCQNRCCQNRCHTNIEITASETS